MRQVAGELMAIESWRDFPILVTVVIINRSKVDAIVEVRQKYRKEQKDRELKNLEKLGQGQFDLQEELEHVALQKKVLRQKILDHDEKQGNLHKAVKQLTEKVTKLEAQPLHTQGFILHLVKTCPILVIYQLLFRSRLTLTSVNSVALNPLLMTNLIWINDVLMSSHTKPIILITFCCQQFRNRLLAKPNPLSDI